MAKKAVLKRKQTSDNSKDMATVGASIPFGQLQIGEHFCFDAVSRPNIIENQAVGLYVKTANDTFGYAIAPAGEESSKFVINNTAQLVCRRDVSSKQSLALHYEIAASVLRIGDLIRFDENWQKVTKIVKTGDRLEVIGDKNGKRYTAADGPSIVVRVQLKPGSFYLCGNRKDALLRICRFIGEVAGSSRLLVHVAGDERPREVEYRNLICKTDETSLSDIYRKCEGVRCPCCQSYNIVAGSGDLSGTSYTVAVRCENCNAEWFDHYELQGIVNLNTSSTAFDKQGKP